MRHLFLVVCFLVIQACSSNDMPAGARAGGFSFIDPAKQKIFLETLREEKIPFKVNEQGITIFLLKDQAKVHGIIREIMYGKELKPNALETAVLVNKYIRDKYETAFKKANIPYRIFESNGVVHIEWRQIYGPEVDIIRQRISEEIMDKTRKETPLTR